MKLQILLARFPFGAIDHRDVTDWQTSVVLKASRNPRITLHTKAFDDYPITMMRNRVCKYAREQGYDVVVMVDNDICPDLPVPGAKPFWDTTLEFASKERAPLIVGAPYCGPPPLSNMYVFRWANWNNPGIIDKDFRLEQYGREEAAQLAGFHRVGALPTGLIWIDMRCLDEMKPPWFYYEYTDHYETEKASTEDVTFTRDANLVYGIPIYCNFDSWCGHWKRFRVDKPVPITVEEIRQNYREAMQRKLHIGDTVIDIRANGIEDRMLPSPEPEPASTPDD
jgi:hypothetical protein